MLRLQTLGGAVVLRESGEPLGGAASHRRSLALLAVLAVAGERGISRDKLVGLFWPEADTERARHSLTQAFYAARRALQCEDLFVATADVRLNSAELSSDVADFEGALDRGKLEEAVALHRGPFLDGFFLAGAPEFERWVAAQRDRLDARLLDAVRELATRASAAGDPRAAADWWRRAAQLRPLDSGVALRFMESMAAAGDRAGALQHARVHEALLREQLELGPDPAVVELTRRLREQAPSGDAPARPPALPAVEVVPDDGAAANGLVATPVVESGQSVSVWEPPPRRALRRPLFVLLALATLLVALGVIVGRLWRPGAAIGPLARSQRVVVAPFRVAGASPSLSYLREGMVELLATRLADDSAAQSVDAGAVLGAWRASGLATTVDVPRDTVVGIAARLGAERVVIGSVVGSTGRLIISATVLGVRSGDVRGEARVEGPADSLTSLVDRLAAGLLVSQAGEEETLASHTTESLSALRAFLAGQAAFRRTDYTAAVHAYEGALRADSTFALAALRLAVTAERLQDVELEARGTALAWRSRRALGERDMSMLMAFAGPRYPAPSRKGELLDSWQHLVELAPLNPESWYMLGSRLLREGRVLGVDSATGRARSALQRALSLDSNYAAAARLLIELGARPGGTGTRDSLAVVTALEDSLSPLAPFLRWRLAAAGGDTIARARERARFDRLGPANLRAIAMTAQFDAVALRDAARAIEILRLRPASDAIRLQALLGAHSLAMNEGQSDDVGESIARLRALQPESRGYLRLEVLDALHGDGDSVVARDAARRLDDLTRGGLAATAGTSAAWLADRCVLAQWRLHAGDSAGVAQAIRDLRSHPSPGDLPPMAAAPAACADLLEGWLAVTSRSSAAVARVAWLDSLAFTAHTAGDAIAYVPLLLARLHEQLGDAPGALRSIRRRAYLTGWPRYLATALRVEGRLALQDADTAGARLAYERYLGLRRAPDAGHAAESAAVREVLQRIGGDR